MSELRKRLVAFTSRWHLNIFLCRFHVHQVNFEVELKLFELVDRLRKLNFSPEANHFLEINL